MAIFKGGVWKMKDRLTEKHIVNNIDCGYKVKKDTCEDGIIQGWNKTDAINKLGQLEDIEEELGIDLKSASELLKWFIDNTMLASELMEFKKSSTHNKRFEGWSHNGYPIQDVKFEEMLELARAIKYKNGIKH